MAMDSVFMLIPCVYHARVHGLTTIKSLCIVCGSRHRYQVDVEVVICRSVALTTNSSEHGQVGIASFSDYAAIGGLLARAGR